MYALAHKGRVLAGPMPWNRGIFDGNLQKLKITKLLPRVAPEQLPLVIDADTAIYEVEYQRPQHNEKIHYLEGPYWQFTETKAIATYLVKDKPLDSIKGNLKQELSEERWKKEVAGITVTVQGKTVSVSTERGPRDIFLQRYSVMADEEVIDWKFAEGWVALTKADLGTIVTAILNHVQESFNWEHTKTQEIDAKTTAEELDTVVIVEESEELGFRSSARRRRNNLLQELE